MEVFNVYLKEGKQFSVTCERFELKVNEFIFFDSDSQPSNRAFLSFSDVAAIVPEHQSFCETYKPFQVYLRKRNKPIQVYALSFDIGQDQRIRFYHSPGLLEFQDIYVASAEVVAIFPSEGLT
ncbi:MAG: hypothetical protein JWM21_948 [Acidobacteria bacterium]|nr:hypothetical protein [Acidobacteriota bacterium]